jgi:hypothetical protein
MGEWHDFLKSLEKGKQGEAVVAKYLGQCSHVVALDYKGDDDVFREQDIDFLVLTRDGREWSIEVKTDYKDSPKNLFYETTSCMKTGSLGCMEKTRAQFIAYYFVDTNVIYWFRTWALRSWFHEHIADPRIHLAHAKNKGYTSEGYLVPLDMLEKENPRWMQVVTLKGEKMK